MGNQIFSRSDFDGSMAMIRDDPDSWRNPKTPQELEISSAYSVHSTQSKASKVSAGDGLIVRGLNHIMWHFVKARRAIRKVVPLKSRWLRPQLRSSANTFENAIEDALRMLESHLPYAVSLDTGIGKNLG